MRVIPGPSRARIGLAMLPLEMLARRDGYTPLAEHPWSAHADGTGEEKF